MNGTATKPMRILQEERGIFIKYMQYHMQYPKSLFYLILMLQFLRLEIEPEKMGTLFDNM